MPRQLKQKLALFILAQSLHLGSTFAQVPFGNNPAAGAQISVGDAKIYYEVYGSGKPVVLLHGGLFGYIDEYASLIPVLAKQYKVIVIATRGHGKSEIGTKPFSYQQFADDTYQVIHKVTRDSVRLVGFSDGADQGYYLVTKHPELALKFIAIGGNWGVTDFSGDAKTFMDNLDGKTFVRDFDGFVKERKKLMPEPDRFSEFVDKLGAVWKQAVYVTPEVIGDISCPTMIMAGEADGCPVERYIEMYRKLKKGSLAIIPGSDHLVLMNKPKLVEQIVLDYLK